MKVTQQTFVFMKTSSTLFIKTIYTPYSFFFRSLQDFFKTSWSRPIYSSWLYVFKTSSRRFEDIFKTSSRRFQDVFKTSSSHFQDVFKTYSWHLQDVFKTFWRCLQDVFKRYHQVKLFLLTLFQDVFEIYSKRFWDVLQRRLFIEDLLRSHFWRIYGQCIKLTRVSKVSRILVSHFNTPFSGCLQKLI